jgi:hypothetical protein
VASVKIELKKPTGHAEGHICCSSCGLVTWCHVPGRCLESWIRVWGCILHWRPVRSLDQYRFFVPFPSKTFNRKCKLSTYLHNLNNSPCRIARPSYSFVQLTQSEHEWGCSWYFPWSSVKHSHGEWTSGNFTGEGVGAECSTEFGGASRVGYEEEAKYSIGHGLKTGEFPRRSNHSILQA